MYFLHWVCSSGNNDFQVLIGVLEIGILLQEDIIHHLQKEELPEGYEEMDEVGDEEYPWPEEKANIIESNDVHMEVEETGE